MALSGCMSCLKSCGYLCGLLAVLNIWFFIGLTVFNAMDNPWIKKELLLMEYTADASQFTAVFGICIAVSNSWLPRLTDNLCFLAQHYLRCRLLRLHSVRLLPG